MSSNKLNIKHETAPQKIARQQKATQALERTATAAETNSSVKAVKEARLLIEAPSSDVMVIGGLPPLSSNQTAIRFIDE